jgi:ABC-type antimicrobial peptide transport system permease subunit
LLFVHVVAFRELLPRLGVFHVLSPMLTLAAMVGTLLAWYGFARWWEKHGFRFGLEWLLRVSKKKPS